MYFRSPSRQSLRQANRFTTANATVAAGMQAIADGILQPVVLLSAITFLFGGSHYQIAAFATAALATWALAPFVLNLVRNTSARTYTLVAIAAGARLIAIGIIGLIAFRINDMSTDRFVGLLVGSYLLYQAASSIAVQGSANLIVGSSRRGSQRGTFRSRWLIAIVAAPIAGAVAWRVLQADGAFQDAVSRLLLLATLAVAAATWFLLQIPGGRATTPRIAMRHTGAAVRDAFRVTGFRRYISYKVLLGLAAAVDPFLIVFGFQELGLGVAYLGMAVFTFAAGYAAGALLWPRWVHRWSPRIPFQIAALLRVCVLIWIVALPAFVTSGFYTDRFSNATVAMRGFAITFTFLGLAASVGAAGNQRYLAQLAPAGALPGSIQASNLVVAVFAFGPLGVAWLLGRYDLERILWGATGIAFVALLASGLLIESRVRLRTPAGAVRSTRQATNTA